MHTPVSPAFTFNTHVEAEEAIQSLSRSGCDVKKLSLVGALEGAVVVGGLSALGAALAQIGVPADQVIKYETALKVDKYVLVVHGSAMDVEKAKSVLDGLKVIDTA